MNKRGWSRVLATLLTVAMIATLLVVPASAEAPADGKYVLDFSDTSVKINNTVTTDNKASDGSDAIKTGTDNYFIVAGGGEQSSIVKDPDSGKGGFGDGYTATKMCALSGKFQFSNNKNFVKFTTQNANVEVKVWWYSKGTDRSLSYYDSTGTKKWTSSQGKTKDDFVDTFTLATAGTYYVSSDQTICLYKIEVIDKGLSDDEIELTFDVGEGLTVTDLTVADASTPFKTRLTVAKNSKISFKVTPESEYYTVDKVEFGDEVLTAEGGVYTIADVGATAATVAITANSTRVPATDVNLSATSLDMKKGDTQALTATLAPENSTDEVIWANSSEGVATLTDGTVEAKAIGKAILTATANENAKKDCVVSVTGPDQNGPTYTFEPSKMGVGGVPKAAGTVTYDNFFTVVQGGNLSVEASQKTFSDGYAGQNRLTVKQAKKDTEGVKFQTSKAADVTVWWVPGGTDRQVAIVGGENDVVSNEENVDSSKLFKSKLELTAGGTYFVGANKNSTIYIYKIEVTESAPVTVSGVTIQDGATDATTKTVTYGDAGFTLGATVAFEDGGTPGDNDRKVTWASDAATVATVDATTGKVTVVGAGTANITATSTKDNTKSATLALTVNKKGIALSGSLSTDELTAAGGTTTFTVGAEGAVPAEVLAAVTVKVYEAINDGTKGDEVTGAVTGSNGSYTVTLPANTATSEKTYLVELTAAASANYTPSVATSLYPVKVLGKGAKTLEINNISGATVTLTNGETLTLALDAAVKGDEGFDLTITPNFAWKKGETTLTATDGKVSEEGDHKDHALSTYTKANATTEDSGTYTVTVSAEDLTPKTVTFTVTVKADLTALAAAITAAEAKKAANPDVVIAANGDNVLTSKKWVTQEVDDALTNALTAAKALTDTAAQADVTAATTALTTATANWEPQAGLKEGPDARWDLDFTATEAMASGATVESVEGIKVTMGCAFTWYAANAAGTSGEVTLPAEAGMAGVLKGSSGGPSDKDAIPADGKSYLKFDATKDGTLTVAYAVFGDNAKNVRVLDATDGTVTAVADAGKTGFTGNGDSTFDVKAGGTYYVFAGGANIGFYGFSFTADEGGEPNPPAPETKTVTFTIGEGASVTDIKVDGVAATLPADKKLVDIAKNAVVTFVAAVTDPAKTLKVTGATFADGVYTVTADTVTVAAMAADEYTITCDTVANGTVSTDKTTAKAGETVTVTATPAAGYKLESIKVDGETITGTTFTMPAKDVTVSATFVADGGNTPDPVALTGKYTFDATKIAVDTATSVAVTNDMVKAATTVDTTDANPVDPMFTVDGTVTTKWEAEGFAGAVELAKKEGGKIIFTIPAGSTATVTVAACSTNTTNESAYAMKKDGAVVANDGGLVSEIVGSEPTMIVYTDLGAGTYEILTPGTARGMRIVSVEVNFGGATEPGPGPDKPGPGPDDPGTDTVDTKALSDAIAAAEKLAKDTYTVSNDTTASKVDSGKKFVKQSAKDALEAAIAAAKDAMAAATTQEDVTKAQEALAAAVATFNKAIQTGTKKTNGSTGSSTSRPSSSRPNSSTATVSNAAGGTTTTAKDASGNVTITATDDKGEVLAEVKLPGTIPALDTKFKDVPAGHWAEKSINAMAALGLVKGVAEETYDMISPITRGSVATILSRLANGKADAEDIFSDVAEGQWFAEGVAWAAKAGVVNGFENGTFRPDDSITREQLAVMLARYAKLLGLDTTAANSELAVFDDADSVQSWALEGMAWCVKAGIINGRGDGTVDPGANATRAEAAAMLARLVDLLK